MNAEVIIQFFRNNSLTLKSKIISEIKRSKMNETKKIKVIITIIKSHKPEIQTSDSEVKEGKKISDLTISFIT